MPCKLKKGNPPRPNEFEAAVGAEVVVFADSTSGTVHIVAATLDGANVAVDASGRVKATMTAGLNLLNMVFAGSDPAEVFQIKEDCGGGDQKLVDWRLRQGPNGEPGGPTKELRIHAKP